MSCYAFALHDKRYASNRKAARDEGILGTNGVPDSEQARVQAPWVLPYPKQYDKPFSTVQLMPERLDWPLRHKKPERIFVDSMSDLWHEDVPDAFITDVFAVMALATWHTFLVLTKRPERMREFIAGPLRHEMGRPYTVEEVRAGEPAGRHYQSVPTWPIPNVWLGVSVENQAAADERIPNLLATPAAVRFLSCEPLLGPVDLTAVLGGTLDALAGDRKTTSGEVFAGGHGIDWVLVGGESGPRHRPMNIAWVESLVKQCKSAGVAVFVKQDGAARPGQQGRIPEELWIHEFPT